MTNNKPMIKRKTFLIIGLFLLILSSFRIGWIIYHKTPDHPHAEEGVIDLSDWTFDDKQTITLDGEWGFYPNQFLDPKLVHTSENDHEQDFISIPGNWAELPDYDKPVNYGTYRVRISLPDHSEQLYGIRIQDISSAASVYVDGKLITKVGQPTESASQYKSKLGTYKAFFHTDSSEIEMIIHVANHENAHDGGITKSIKLGTEEALNLS